MKIRVDTRECDELLEAFAALRLDKGFELASEQLLSGDIVIGSICFERKEAGDFVSSILDGRLESQAANMLSNFSECYIIVVGSLWDSQSAINPHAVIGMQASLVMKGFSFLQVQDNAGCAYMCWNIAHRHEQLGKDLSKEHAISRIKLTQQDRVTAVLADTGIGVSRARKIAEACGYNIAKLVWGDPNKLEELDGIGKETVKKLFSVLPSFYTIEEKEADNDKL